MDLKTLTEINAPSGHEQAIRRFLLDELKKLGFAPVLDRMGNVVVVKEGTGDAPRKRVMVSAHMDEVGLIVTSATEDGYLRIAAAGGIDPRVLVSKRVTVGDDKLPGVIGAVPIHLQSAAERKHVLSMDELLVDIGAKNKDEAERKAPMGTYISFDTPYVEYNEIIRVQFIFPGKPDDETRTMLKENGFRWAPSQGAWQRQLTANAKYAAHRVIEFLDGNENE